MTRNRIFTAALALALGAPFALFLAKVATYLQAVAQ